MCYHDEFGSSALKDLGTNTGEPQKLWSAGTPPPGGAWLTPKNKPIPRKC